MRAAFARRAWSDMPAIRTPRLNTRRSRQGPTVALTADGPPGDPATITGSGIRWIHIPKPRQAAREWLEQRFEFHALDYEDVYSRNQRPKVDRYDDYLFVVLQFPRYDATASA